MTMLQICMIISLEEKLNIVPIDDNNFLITHEDYKDYYFHGEFSEDENHFTFIRSYYVEGNVLNMIMKTNGLYINPELTDFILAYIKDAIKISKKNTHISYLKHCKNNPQNIYINVLHRDEAFMKKNESYFKVNLYSQNLSDIVEDMELDETLTIGVNGILMERNKV